MKSNIQEQILQKEETRDIKKIFIFEHLYCILQYKD